MPVTIDNSAAGATIGPFGEGTVAPYDLADSYWGQTFKAAGNGMQSLTYYMTTESAAPTKYNLLITTIEETPTGVRPGRIIKEVTGLVEPGGPDGFTTTAVTVDLSGVRLEKGETYAFILDSKSAEDGVADVSFIGFNGSLYSDGEHFNLPGPYTGSRESDFELDWNTPPGDIDLRFIAEFSDTGKTIKGTKKDDKLKGTADDDTINGKKGDDVLKAKAGFDTLIGGKDADVLKGGDDGDLLIGGKARDKLYGQEGYDCYVFDFKMTKKSAKKHWDKIYGFETNKDEIHLKQKHFSDLALGELPDSDTHITYKKKALFYNDVKFVKFKDGAPSSLDDIDIVVVA